MTTYRGWRWPRDTPWCLSTFGVCQPIWLGIVNQADPARAFLPQAALVNASELEVYPAVYPRDDLVRAEALILLMPQQDPRL
jgi:hypothetical protein